MDASKFADEAADLTRMKSTGDIHAQGLSCAPFASLQLPALPSPAVAPVAPAKRIGLNPVTVMKFGGSSLAGAEHLQRVASIVRERLPERPILVLSAMGKTTNELLAATEMALGTGNVDISKVRALHEDVLKELGVAVPEDVDKLFQELSRILSGVSLLKEVSLRTRDLVVSFGERLSVRVFAAFFNTLKGEGLVPARALDSWDIGMVTTSGAGSTDSAHSGVSVLPRSYENIGKFLEPLQLSYSFMPVVTGYIAHDEKGAVTTLGRDGSDLTATIVGAAVQAVEVQIWKDVSGILTTDPRMVSSAQPVPLLTFEEAAELSTFGAKVVHPAAVLPAWDAKVPMSVRNSLKPSDPGTRIVAELAVGVSRKGRVTAMSSKQAITMIHIRSTRMLGQHGFLAHVFQVFNEFEASIDVIATSEVSVSMTLDPSYKDIDLVGLRLKLEKVAHVEIKEQLAMLTLITDKSDSTFVLRECFDVFQENGITVEMVSQGASNVNVTFILPGSSLMTSIKKLHEVFFDRPVESVCKRQRVDA